MKLTFDMAEQADVDVILNLMGEFYSHEKLPFEESNAQDALTRLIADKAFGRIWLIKNQEKIIGYVILTFGYGIEFHGRDAFIDKIFIEQEYRGKGIGTKVIEFVESYCRKSGIQALHLEVERKNKDAQNFYQKLGFQDHDRYLMTKRLR